MNTFRIYFVEIEIRHYCELSIHSKDLFLKRYYEFKFKNKKCSFHQTEMLKILLKHDAYCKLLIGFMMKNFQSYNNTSF